MGFAERIFSAATGGTNTNPGLPNNLAALLVAQSQLETGNFTSNFFKNYNNAFGYSYTPLSIYQTGSGTLADNGQPIASYSSIEQSTREIIDWIYRRVKEGKFPSDLRTITTPDQYAALLKNAGYYQDSLANYTAGLKKFFTQVLEIVEKPTAQLIMLAVIGGVIFYYTRKR